MNPLNADSAHLGAVPVRSLERNGHTRAQDGSRRGLRSKTPRFLSSASEGLSSPPGRARPKVEDTQA